MNRHLTLTDSFLDDHALGVPGVDGRWQPTRAGVVNSWAWADETLLFGDGWLALTGPNGSGKSLTASMLITVLLDADTSQTALSVSGKAAGTLVSRHTNRNDKEDRTGIWWLEYGMRDPRTGTTTYLTTGLWLRATSGTLQRAFITGEGRVGREIVLHRDGNPEPLAELAAQLKDLNGEIYTSSSALRPKAQTHLRSVGEERGYREAVRTKLFAPLDEVQFEALIGVLRSLRSLRTAEAISPSRMREVLTGALPALDPDHLVVVAETMERIADLEQQLKRTKQEIDLLGKTDDLYRRYITAVTRVEAAALIAANTDFDARTREETEARRQLESAETAKDEAIRDYNATQDLLSQWDGRREAAATALRDHAGGELPLLVRLAEELAAKAAVDAKRATQCDVDTSRAQARAEQSAEARAAGCRHLIELGEDLRASAASLGAESVVERALAAAAGSTADPEAVSAAQQLAATPSAWVEARSLQVRQVQETLRDHELAQVALQGAATTLRETEGEEDGRRRLADRATNDRQAVEAAMVDQLWEWSSHSRLLGPVPDALTTTADDERLDVDAFARWVQSAATAARDRIDVTGHRRTADREAVRAESAREHVTRTRDVEQAAHGKAEAAERAWHETEDKARVQTDAAQRRRAEAEAERASVAKEAEEAVAAAQAQLASGEAHARSTASEWLAVAHEWRAGLVFLSGTNIRIPDGLHGTAPDDWIDQAEVRLDVSRAHQEATARLLPFVTTAEQKCATAAAEVRSIELELEESSSVLPVPVAPPWRRRSAEDGVPLWAAVEFADHVTPDQANMLEGAMLVANLLDALVRDDNQVVVGDVTISTTTPAAGRTLHDLLRADPECGIPSRRVEQVLRSIPVDSPVGDAESGVLAVGVLTASAPPDHQASFIGRTARERARTQRITELRNRLAMANDQLAETQQEVERRVGDVSRAAEERDAFPSLETVVVACRRVTELRYEVGDAERRGAEQIRQADAVLSAVVEVLASEAAARERRVAEALYVAEAAAAALLVEQQNAAAAAETAAAAAEILRTSQDRLAVAIETQRMADEERFAFPDTGPLAAACVAEDQADEELTRARAAVLAATERYASENARVQDALRELNRTAQLPTGALLPTDRTVLVEFGDGVVQLGEHIRGWVHAATRVTELWRRALAEMEEAEKWAVRAHNAHREANDSRLAASQQAEHVAHLQRLHGADYERLQLELTEISGRLHEIKEKSADLIDRRQDAAAKAESARATLNGIAPRREMAEAHREACLTALGRLVDEGFAVVPEDIGTTESGRPAHITAGLTWARRMLTDVPAGPERLAALNEALGRALKLLERNVIAVSRELAIFDRQVTLFGLEGTTWRRAEIADPEAPRGQDLHAAVEDLRLTADGLESDLSEDVKRTMKSSMFTQLRQDIMLRREAARSLVHQIGETLAKVRTGVAKVGVKVDWVVRKEDDAARMVHLIEQPPSDEAHDQMYTVLRQRMQDKEGEPWADRVAHAFDYRSWHEWKIWVTHASFDAGESSFKEVTARSNPMESLSTGERRLAIMLPLLAAAWSMYSGSTFRGPRLVSIDEIDAAFDEPNLRQILALLRSWNFDVLATAPFMTPMMKVESQRIVVHEVVGTGRERITVPWLWEGHGEPQLLSVGQEAER